MAETPKRAGPTLITAAATSQTVYTAPAGGSTWALLREIIVCNETVGATVKFSIGIGTSNADAAGKRIAKDITLTAGQVWTWGGFMVLNGGGTPDLLYAICDTANGVSVTVGLVEGP